MKTYTTTIEQPRLVIEHDQDAESPRQWDNLGYFITISNKRTSPDNNTTLYNIIEDTSNEADNLDEHIKLIKERYEAASDEKVLAIYPVSTYEHSGISYSLGSKHGFDHSNNSFYVVTNKTANLVGTKRKSFENVIKSELEIYTNWANGEVYQFCLFGQDGEVIDSCGGFYDVEDIRESLPSEFQKEDLIEYIK